MHVVNVHSLSQVGTCYPASLRLESDVNTVRWLETLKKGELEEMQVF